MPSGRQGHVLRPDAGFALPIMLLAIAIAAVAASSASVPLSYRLAREREAEFHFRARAYVAAIRSFYLAEPNVQQRRLPTNFEELERDPRFAKKRHIRRLYDDPLAKKPGTQFRLITGSVRPGQAQGLIGVASSVDVSLLRRAGFATRGGPTLGVATAKDLTFEVDFQALIAGESELMPQAPVNSVSPQDKLIDSIK